MLQQTCAKRWGYSADFTLEIAQSLYETHKLLTYPRTDCRYLSDQHLEKCSGIFDSIISVMPDLETGTGNADTSLLHKAFNAKKIIAHHGICPTKKLTENVNLTPEESNVYRLVSLSYISLFYPEAVREKSRLTLIATDGREYLATNTKLISGGWEPLLKNDANKSATADTVDLSEFTKGSKVSASEFTVDKKATNPPKYFVESTILAAMTKASKYVGDPALRKSLEENDGGSIGTEATRAAILKKVKENTKLISIETMKGYKEKVWITTNEAQEFCAALPAELTLPDTSALWSQKQKLIIGEELSVNEFIDDVDIYLDDLIKKVKSKGILITPNMDNCPLCKVGYVGSIEGKKGFFWYVKTAINARWPFQTKMGSRT